MLELQDQTSEGVNLLLGLAKDAGLEVKGTQDVCQRRPPFEEIAPIGESLVGQFFLIVLVRDLTDNLL